MRFKSERQRNGSDTQGGRSQAAAGAGRGGQAGLLRERPHAQAATKGHVGKWQPNIKEIVLSKHCTIKDLVFFFSKSLIIV